MWYGSGILWEGPCDPGAPLSGSAAIRLPELVSFPLHPAALGHEHLRDLGRGWWAGGMGALGLPCWAHLPELGQAEPNRAKRTCANVHMGWRRAGQRICGPSRQRWQCGFGWRLVPHYPPESPLHSSGSSLSSCPPPRTPSDAVHFQHRSEIQNHLFHFEQG